MSERTQSLLQAATEVAEFAASVAMRWYGATVQVETKGDGSPVTIADREAEREARAWIEARFPNDGLFGEEFENVRPEAKRRWIFDPIDGTKAFVRGVPLWGTLVACCEGDTVLAGAACYPAVKETVSAAPGEGCWWNGSRASVSTVSSLREATALITDNRFPERPHRRDAWFSLVSEVAVCRTWGDCYGYLLVATGRAEIMVDDIMNPWDSAALQPIITEAGGRFSDWRGNSTAFGGDVIATNSALANATRRYLLETPDRFMTTALALDLDSLDFAKGGGLVTVVTQDARTGVVLMVAHADREALEHTLRSGEMHYRSRSRGLWHKGGTSGNVQRVVSLTADCDGDAILARVIAAGPACHNGTTSCFRDEALQSDTLATLDATIAERAQSVLSAGERPSYTQRLLTDRNLRLKKLGEEAVELTIACVDGDAPRAAEETADLVYHALVALHAVGGTLDDVRAVLGERAK